MIRLLWICCLWSFCTLIILAEPLAIDRSRMRDLTIWKPAVRNYSFRHYGEYTWKLRPTCIVLHYTATGDFPDILTKSQSFAGETPGLGVHYVVEQGRVFETIPPSVRSRGCYGLNHRAINIEMVAWNEQDLWSRGATLGATLQLCKKLMRQFNIPVAKVYGHSEVALMDQSIVPEVLDKVDPSPYHKIDPGSSVLRWFRGKLLQY